MKPKRLVVCVNHAAPFHVGGSEKVVQQVTESMTQDYGMECIVLAKWADRETVKNGVRIMPHMKTERLFMEQLRTLKPDHTFVYSDSFLMWPALVRHPETIPGKKSIALVGMNHMRAHGDTFASFQRNHEHFQVITHSDDYLDYTTCESMDIPVEVIRNAVDLNEFKPQGFSFREMYNIPKDKKLILCVSNFFPGKGQEHLHHILTQVNSQVPNIHACFISTNVNFAPAETLRRRHDMMRRKAKYSSISLKNISRQETIQAFFESDVFAFPSQTEVAPLVVLECMAAGLPYVSLNVGNVPSLAGGIVCRSNKKQRGQLQYSTPVYKAFSDGLTSILTDNDLRNQLSRDGKELMLRDYDWSKIKEQYRDVFQS